ncbi:hypothetical protein DFP72DRAFT_872109, partial [Ephemerocybe angulata]
AGMPMLRSCRIPWRRCSSLGAESRYQPQRRHPLRKLLTSGCSGAPPTRAVVLLFAPLAISTYRRLTPSAAPSSTRRAEAYVAVRLVGRRRRRHLVVQRAVEIVGASRSVHPSPPHVLRSLCTTHLEPTCFGIPALPTPTPWLRPPSHSTSRRLHPRHLPVSPTLAVGCLRLVRSTLVLRRRRVAAVVVVRIAPVVVRPP